MQDFQMRVVEEKKELDIKIEGLSKFIKGDFFSSLDRSEQVRMAIQSGLMRNYSDVLQERINNFK